MKVAFKKFGDVILIDGTFKLNSHGYILYPICVIDENEKTLTVGLILVADEKLFTLEEAFKVMKDCNDLSVVRYVMTDKQVSEINALQKVIPQAQFLLCQWHAQKTIKEYIKKLKLSEQKFNVYKEMLGTNFNKMLYATSEEEYNKHFKSLSDLCNLCPDLEQYKNYYTEHWHNIRQMWADRHLCTYEHLRTFTNNRSENNNMVIKKYAKLNSSLIKLYESLFLMINEQYKNHTFRNLTQDTKQFLPNDVKSELEKELIHFMNLHVRKSINDEVRKEFYEALNLLHNNDSIYAFSNLYLDKNQTSCTLKKGCCKTQSNKVPCRHLFLTKIYNKELLIDRSIFDQRWLIDIQEENTINIQSQHKILSLKKSQLEEDDEIKISNILINIRETLTRSTDKERIPLTKELDTLNYTWLSEINNNIEYKSLFMKVVEKKTTSDRERYLISAQIIDLIIKTIEQFDKDEHYNKYSQLNKINEKWIEANLHSKPSEKLNDINMDLQPRIKRNQSLKSNSKLPKKKKIHHYFNRKVSPELKENLNKLPQLSEVENENENENSNTLTKHELNSMYKLSLSDYEFNIIKNTSSHDWLTDNHLELINILCRNEFKLMQGLEYVQNNAINGFKIINTSEKFCQLINTGNNHWILLSNAFIENHLKNNYVSVYDSMINTENVLTSSTIEQICQLYNSKNTDGLNNYNNDIIVRIESCYQQTDSHSCGLISIANLISILFDHNPAEVTYTGNFREDFLQIIQKMKLSMFRHKRIKSHNLLCFKNVKKVSTGINLAMNNDHQYLEINIKRFCYCRMPFNENDMFQCEKCSLFYHHNCNFISKNLQLKKFMCLLCKADISLIDGKKINEGDLEEIKAFDKYISKHSDSLISSFINGKCYSNSPLPICENLKELRELENICSKLNFNTTLNNKGHIYYTLTKKISNLNSKIKSISELDINKIVYLLLLIFNTNCPISFFNKVNILSSSVVSDNDSEEDNQ